MNDATQLATLERLLGAHPGRALVEYDADGVVVQWSNAAAALFGHKVEDVVELQTTSLLHAPAEWNGLIEKLTKATDGAYLQRASVRHRNGLWLPARVTLTTRPSGRILVLYEDLVPEERTQKQLRELRESSNANKRQSEKEAEFLRELLRHTIETIQIGLVVQEASSSMIAYINEGFSTITGIAGPEVLGANLSTLLAEYPAAREQLVAFSERIISLPESRPEDTAPGYWELDFPAGRKSVEVYGRIIEVEGHQSRYLLLIIEDYTERQKLQRQLVQSEKLAAVGQLAAGIAHEIRNPLNTIYNALFDLNEIVTHRTPDITEDIDIAIEEIRRVQDIINNLLDFARESERSAGRTNLTEVLQKTIRLVQHDLTNRRIEVRLFTQNLPAVAISSNALKQILINLITNGAQAMTGGGVLTISCEVRDGQVPLRPLNARAEAGSFRLNSAGDNLARMQEMPDYRSHVVLEIADTGSGIPANILPDIFNPFFTTKAPGSGTGLGLSVVHSLVQEAGGSISVRSSVGHGTSFVIELPALMDD